MPRRFRPSGTGRYPLPRCRYYTEMIGEAASARFSGAPKDVHWGTAECYELECQRRYAFLSSYGGLEMAVLPARLRLCPDASRILPAGSTVPAVAGHSS